MKIETTTSLVLRTLVTCDDFRTCKQLCDLTGRKFNQVSAALHHLRVCKAVEVIEQPDNLWWYATPENDTRSITRDMRKPEIHRNRKCGKPHKRGPKRQTSK
jgi:hypothetical protein